MTYTIDYYDAKKKRVGFESDEFVTDSAAAFYASVQVYDYSFKRGYDFFVLRNENGAIVASGNRSSSNIKFY